MKQLSVILVLFFSFTLINAQSKDDDKEKAAVKAATGWLKIVDKGNYEQSWDECAKLFKAAVTKEQWPQMLNASIKPLGELKKREVISKTYATELPNAPKGEYYVFVYKTSYANKAEAVETITVMLEKDGKWKAAGYFIK